MNLEEEISCPKMLTIRQAAATGVLPEHCLRTMVKQGKVPGFYAGAKYLINYGKLVEQLNAV